MKSKIMLTLLGCCYSTFTFAACNVNVNMAGNSITGIGAATLNAAQSNPGANDLITRSWATSNLGSGAAYATYTDEYGDWINIPAYTLPGGQTVKAFSVMKYEAKRVPYPAISVAVNDTTATLNLPSFPMEIDTNGSYTDAVGNTLRVESYGPYSSIIDVHAPVSSPNGRAVATWVQSARTSCMKIGADIIHPSQYYSLAHQILNNGSNWYTGTGLTSSGVVGNGMLPSGRMTGSTNETATQGVAADSADANVYYKTSVDGNNTAAWNIATGDGGEQVRVFYLGGTTSKIWDLAGNAWEQFSMQAGSTLTLGAGDFGQPTLNAGGQPIGTTDTDKLMSAAYYAIPFINLDANNLYNATTSTVLDKATHNVGVIATVDANLNMIYGGGMGFENASNSLSALQPINGTPNIAGLFTIASITQQARVGNPMTTLTPHTLAAFRCVN